MTKDIIERTKEYTVENLIKAIREYEGKDLIEDFKLIPKIEGVIASTQEERDRSWRERIEGMLLDTDDETLEVNKDITDFARRCGFNLALKSLLSTTKTSEK